MPSTVGLRTKSVLAFCFACFAGYANVICLIRYKVLPSMMTGNLLQLGRSLVEDNIDAVLIILIIVCRMGGLAIHHFAKKRFAYGTTLLTPLLLFTIVCVERTRYVRHWRSGVLVPFDQKYEVCFLAPVFGVQAAVSMQGCLGCPTTLGTGHLQNLSYSLIGWGSGKAVDRVKCICDCAIIAGLAVGALCGSMANSFFQGCAVHEFLLSIAMLPLIVLFAIDDYLSTPDPFAPKRRQISFMEKLFARPKEEKKES